MNGMAERGEAVDHLRVELGLWSYDVVVGPELAGAVAAEVAAVRGRGGRVAVVTDAAVAAAQADWLAAAAPGAAVLALPPGESSKSLERLGEVLQFLAGVGVDRGGMVLAVGGGVVGDLAGFAAAVWLRGVACVQVPTTLLAMVDSSVGGKTGINLPEGKNLVGSFWQPRAVFADTRMLATLPAREFAAGMAEVIKYGLLGDPELLERLENGPLLGPDSSDLAAVIRRCAANKAEIVAGDEREERADGGRALLNLGHTFGHAIEAVAGYGAYLHGEAVAVGLVLAARLSEGLGRVPTGTADRVARLVERYGLPARLREPLAVGALLAAMRRDKKVRAGRLRFIVMVGWGSSEVVTDIAEAQVEALWLEAGADNGLDRT